MRISNAQWQGALLALVMSYAGTSLGQSAAEGETIGSDAAPAEAPADDGKAAKRSQADEKESPPRPFIERSLVMAPEQVGKFKLVKMNDYPGQPGAGIQLRYEHEDFPGVRVDLFVYPAGRVDRQKVLISAMSELRASVQYAVDQGQYSGLVWGEESDFDLANVQEDGSILAPRVAETPDERGGEAAEIEATIAAAQAREDYRVGRRLDARMNIGDEAMNTRGYLFYRGLFLVKGRVSAPPKLMPGEIFDRFTNHAMATLVPEVRVRSTGDCHKSTIYYDPESKNPALQLAGQMAATNVRTGHEQCAKVLDENVAEGYRAMPLVFDPSMWGGKG
jgi:hypothetical protein